MRFGGFLIALTLVGLGAACSGGAQTPADRTVVVEIDAGADATRPVAFPEPGGLGLVAFIRDGNVWVKPVPDGPEVQLTEDGTYSHPRWSRDGTWLAVDRDRERWLIASDGERLKLWSERAHCPADASPGACLQRILSTNGPAIDPELLLPRRTAINPSRSHAAIGTQPIPLSSPAAASAPDRAGKPGELLVVELQTGAEQRVAVAQQEGGLFYPIAWSLDGGYVVAGEAPTLSASLLAGGAPLRLVDFATGEVVELPFALLYADHVVPGPHTIAIVSGGGREAWNGKRLHVVDLRGEPRLIEPAGVPAGHVTAAAWSVDGLLAYVVGEDLGLIGGGETARLGLMSRRIYLHDLTTGDVRRLLDDSAYRDEHPEWSYEGDEILFARFDNHDAISLWLASTRPDPTPRLVAERLTADPQTGWFGYYGHVDWDGVYDWWQPAAQ